MGKIVNIVFELKTYDFLEPFHITDSISDMVTNIEVRVVLDNGAIGFGEASPSYRVNGERVEALIHLKDFVKDEISGMEVGNYKRLFDILDKLKSAPSIKSAVQYAVLDAFGEEIRVPVFKILGGAEDEIETDKTVGINTLDKMVKKATEIKREGFNVIKIKVGEDLREDIDKMIAISEATKGAEYIVDANMGYTPKEAVHFAKQVYSQGIDIAVFEQPTDWINIDLLKFVRFNCPYPVAADESVKTQYDAFNLIKNEAVDFINIKIMKSGISDTIAISEMAKSAGVGLMIGSMGESSIGINQSVHIAAGLGGFTYHDLDSHLLLKEDGFRGKFEQKGQRMILK